MLCHLTYTPRPIAETVRTPFVYPASLPLRVARRASCVRPPLLIIEVGPGRGDFLFHLAETNPDAVVVGIEIKRKRVDRLIRRIEKRSLKNVCLIQDDARCALPRFFADETVDAIHINFPDPWPKRRHAKNRAVTAGFLVECKRVLKIGGTISIATDDESYVSEITRRIGGIPDLKEYESEICSEEPPDVFPTLFATKWKDQGRPTFYRRFVKALR